MKSVSSVKQHLSEQGYLVSQMPVRTGIEEVLEHYKQMELNTSIPRNLKVAIDCSQADFDFKPDQISRIIKAADLCLSQYERITEAIIVKQPYETAIATIFETRAQQENYTFKVFSTEASAIEWLDSLST